MLLNISVKKTKIFVIFFVIIVVILSSIIAIIYIKESKTPCAYLATLTDEKNVILYDENKNEITTFAKNDGVKNKVILLEKPVNKNKLYEVVVLEETGEMLQGYIKGKYFNKKITKIKDYDISDGLGEVLMVNASKGVYVRQEKIVDKNTDTAKLLPSGTYVLAGVSQTSLHNSYVWKRVLYFDSNENIKAGYIASDYLQEVPKQENESEEFKIEYTSLSKIEPLVVDEDDTIIIKQVNTSNLKNADLKLKESPGESSKVLARLENGTEVYTTQKYIKECNLSKFVDGYKWLQVILEDGETGYVIQDFLEDSLEKDLKTFIEEYKEIYDEGTFSGFTGIDVAPRYLGSVGDFEKILNGQNNSISGTNVNFVYIRIGATAYGSNFKFVGKDGKADTKSVEAEIQAVRSYIRKCEQYKIPYGFYYFSQAITEDETAQELEYIKYVLNGMGELKYNVMPFALDVEKNTDGTRILKFASQSNASKKELTNLKQKMMEKLRSVLNQEVILYTDHNALKEILDLDTLSEKNKNEMWIVDFGSSHSKDILDLEIVDYIGNRQIAEEDTIDIDFVNSEVFTKYLENMPNEDDIIIETIIGEVGE